MYNYKDLKPQVFEESNQKDFLFLRDEILKLLNKTGVITMEKAISIQSGDSWLKMAFIDRLVEIGEIGEVNHGAKTGNDRIFKLKNKY